MNGADRHHSWNRSSGSLDGDSLTFNLLIEQCCHPPGYAAQSQVAVRPEIPNDVSRLIERADQQPLSRAAAVPEPHVAGSVSRGAGQKPKQGVHQGLLV